jgi:hypothetical protein
VTLKSILRRAVYLFEKRLQRLRFSSLTTPQGGWPVLLGLSFPKSGTHLLDQILLGFSKVAPYSRRLHSFYAEYEGESGRKRTPEMALAWLNSLGSGDVASAHLFARLQVVERITSLGFVPYFIFRDPRDVVVSHVHYVTDMETRHVHHAYYRSLPDFDARLSVSIRGRPDTEVEFPDIAARFAPYLGWLVHAEVLTIHFEDLIDNRTASLTRIMDHLLARVAIPASRERILNSLATSIDPSKSPTFRSGRTGEWRKSFTNTHITLFKEVAGDLLVKLKYEQDNDW